MMPIKRSNVSSPWAQLTKHATSIIDKITGTSPYKAYAGIFTGLHQVYYITIQDKLPNGLLLIVNPPEPGQKKSVKETQAQIEPELIYPLARGKNVKKWYIEFTGKYIIVPHDNSGRPIEFTRLKSKYPYSWQYFLNYYDALIKRSGGFFKSRLRAYNVLRELSQVKL